MSGTPADKESTGQATGEGPIGGATPGQAPIDNDPAGGAGGPGWLETRVRQARNPPPPVLRAVIANMVVAIAGAIVLIAWDWYAARHPSVPDVGLGLTALYVVVVLVAGSILTWLWVELPTGSSGMRRRSPWAALLGFFAAVPIVYLVLVVALQVIRPLRGCASGRWDRRV